MLVKFPTFQVVCVYFLSLPFMLTFLSLDSKPLVGENRNADTFWEGKIVILQQQLFERAVGQLKRIKKHVLA